MDYAPILSDSKLPIQSPMFRRDDYPRDESVYKSYAEYETFVSQITDNIPETEDEHIISPLSVYFALMLVFSGSNDETEKEIERILGIKKVSCPDKAEEMYRHISRYANVTNSIWIKDGYNIMKSYVKLCKTKFHSHIGMLNKGDINRYVERATDGMIKNVIDNISPLTQAILINTIYFNQQWKYTFEPTRTQRQFFTPAGQRLKPYMYVEVKDNRNFYYTENDRMEMLAMPFRDDKGWFIVTIPRSGVKPKNMLDTRLKQRLSASYSQVKVYMPKFSVENKIILNEPLKRSGLRRLFIPGKCDLSGLSVENDLYVNEVFQKARIDVNERGVKAAAATVIACLEYCASPRVNSVVVDINRPFHFAIVTDRVPYSSNTTILFQGIVENPEYSGAD